MPRLIGCTLEAVSRTSWLLALVALGGCAKPLGDGECDVLLDHYTERLLVEERPRISQTEIRKKQDEARRLAKSGERFEYARCSELVSRDEFECAMKASSVDSIERCLL